MRQMPDFDIEIVRISFCIWNSPPNSSHVSMYLSIWHGESTELDSLFLRFSTQSYFASLYLKASDCVWPEASFRQDNLDAILAVNDLGSYDAGTATLEFILIANEHTENFALTIDFSLHYAKPLRARH